MSLECIYRWSVFHSFRKLVPTVGWSSYGKRSSSKHSFGCRYDERFVWGWAQRGSTRHACHGPSKIPLSTVALNHVTICMSADRSWTGCVPLSGASEACHAAMVWCDLSSDPDRADVQPHSTPAGFCEDDNLAIPLGGCCNNQLWISRNCWLIGSLFLSLWIAGYVLYRRRW